MAVSSGFNRSKMNQFNGDQSFDFEELGFCAILQKGGTTLRSKSKNIKDFHKMIEKASVAWVDYTVNNIEREAIQAATAMGFSENLLKHLLKSQKSGYEDFGVEMGILLPAMTVAGFDVKLNSLLVLIRKNLILTIHPAETTRFFRVRRYAETLMKKIPRRLLQQDKLTLLLIRLIDENNSRTFEYLSEIEQQGDKLSKDLSNPKTSREMIGRKIYTMKHALIIYLGGLWSTVDVLNSLRYGDADLLTDDSKILDRINALVGEVNSQIGLAEHLSEVLASGLEVLQSIYNNQLQILNNRLALLVAYLTILGTALLVPNTIATVAGNSMFGFTSADVGWYLLLIVVSTVLATFLAWYMVKKMNLLPRSPE